MDDLDEIAISAAKIAAEAGELIVSKLDIAGRCQRSKGPYDVQLDIDVEAEKLIVSFLRQRYPHARVVSEEMTEAPVWTDEAIWIVDPLDGTNNFAVGIPYVAVSICLRNQGKLQLAVIRDPITPHTYQATLAEGASCDGQVLDLRSRNRSLRGATVSLVTDYSDAGRRTGQQVYLALSGNVRRVTTMWAPAADLARIAKGQLDAMLCFEALYGDVCGGLLLIHEAGGVIMNLNGKPLDIQQLDPGQPVSFVTAADYALCVALLQLL